MSDDRSIGVMHWAISAGDAPSRGTGREPEFGSFDMLCLLNAGDAIANVRMRVMYADHGEAGPYRLTVAPRRVRHLRVNDLIFPEAVRLDEAYGVLIDSDVPVVVQFSRQDTRQRENARMLGTAWPG